MSSLQSNKNITINFTEDQIELLDSFSKYCKSNYTTRSGWIKRQISKQLQKEKLVKVS